MSVREERENSKLKSLSDVQLSLAERALAAASAAAVSAIIVNPLDVAKMLPDLRSNQSRNGIGPGGGSACAAECSRYKGTFDVFFKVVHQEGLSRLWRGTNASLALAIPSVSVFSAGKSLVFCQRQEIILMIAMQVGIYLPCYDVLRNYLEKLTEQHGPSLSPYSPLVAGSSARLLACVACYPIELARTRMQAFKVTQPGVKPPGVWETLLGVVSSVRSANHFQKLQSYRVLWTGLGAQLARDVPFSAICWGMLEPIRRRLLSLTGDEVNATSILGANFSAGFVAGSLAAAATCPLDVARTRRQIENDPTRQMMMTTRRTLLEIWRDGGWKGLFTGIGPRVVRAGPSVGIVVSSYEVVKYALYHRHVPTD
ncbi:hypothetical protein Cgig2_030408 [Carnegiea gigantea]|uniref:Mitochondrial carrier protein n=1 Tax=Carnegiea gigantea TaxID=171969 RepID=A0A9Q1QK54_9CARY|nr:hypothetical protein Cgig2_030408 [Carnegiea gigantea]